MDYVLHMIFKDEDGKNTDIQVHYAKDPSTLTDTDVNNAMNTIISSNCLRSPGGKQLTQKIRAYDEGTQNHEFNIT